MNRSDRSVCAEARTWNLVGLSMPREGSDGVLTMSRGSPDNQLVFRPAEKQIKPVPDEQLGDPEETVIYDFESNSVTIENTEEGPVE